MKFTTLSSVIAASATILLTCQPGYSSRESVPHYVFDPFLAQCYGGDSTASSRTIQSQKHGFVVRLDVAHGGVAEANVNGLTANPPILSSRTHDPITFNVAGPTTDIGLQVDWTPPGGTLNTVLFTPGNFMTIKNGHGAILPGPIAVGSKISVINFIVGAQNAGNNNGPAIRDDINGIVVDGRLQISPGVQAPSQSCP